MLLARPRVMSAVVKMRPLPGERIGMIEEHFTAVVKAAFAHRRKTLENSLGLDPFLGRLSGWLLAQAGIDGHRRAEDLNVQEYRLLAHEYFAWKTKSKETRRNPGATGRPVDARPCRVMAPFRIRQLPYGTVSRSGARTRLCTPSRVPLPAKSMLYCRLIFRNGPCQTMVR